MYKYTPKKSENKRVKKCQHKRVRNIPKKTTKKAKIEE